MHDLSECSVDIIPWTQLLVLLSMADFLYHSMLVESKLIVFLIT